MVVTIHMRGVGVYRTPPHANGWLVGSPMVMALWNAHKWSEEPRMSRPAPNKPAAFRLVLQVEIEDDDASGVPVVVRLRRLLKQLLRQFGFRLKDISECK